MRLSRTLFHWEAKETTGDLGFEYIMSKLSFAHLHHCEMIFAQYCQRIKYKL